MKADEFIWKKSEIKFGATAEHTTYKFFPGGAPARTLKSPEPYKENPASRLKVGFGRLNKINLQIIVVLARIRIPQIGKYNLSQRQYNEIIFWSMLGINRNILSGAWIFSK